jgi:hypothetical protein
MISCIQAVLWHAHVSFGTRFEVLVRHHAINALLCLPMHTSKVFGGKMASCLDAIQTHSSEKVIMFSKKCHGVCLCCCCSGATIQGTVKAWFPYYLNDFIILAGVYLFQACAALDIPCIG